MVGVGVWVGALVVVGVRVGVGVDVGATIEHVGSSAVGGVDDSVMYLKLPLIESQHQ